MQIAIVEDDINMRKSLEIALKEFPQYTITSFKNAKDALKKLDASYDLIITDINMPGMDGLEFIQALKHPYEIIIITGNATLQRAIESIHLGVKDFLLKPFEIDTLVTAINRSSNIVKKQPKKVHTTSSTKQANYVATSKRLQHTLELAERAAKTDASILILGESGVGKEVLARHIHTHSSRANAPFIALNMAAIPDNLIESELFGFEKGAFTDASSAKEGLFESADGGTLFLDEIAEMPFHLQAKLLRALQEREVQRLGSSKKRKIDIRILCATNANLEDKIEQGEFREDLYYRINTIPLLIPPLRERQDEIIPIALQTLQNVCTQYDFSEKKFSTEAESALLEYSWPGNIRELISVIERAAILSDGIIIDESTLFLQSRGAKKPSLAQMEKELILETLKKFQNDLTKSAQHLGMNLEHFNDKLKEYAIF